MSMTHYMELLATAQPWNLIIFMAIPVILAETIAVSELYLLFTRNLTGAVRRVSRYAGIVLGAYFAAVFCYLFATVVVPLTTEGLWRGVADVIAVLSYLSGVIPLGLIALLDAGFIMRGASAEEKLRFHAICVGAFLVVAHVAMIFGMLDPQLLGWSAPVEMMEMSM